jgi:hypothetical protein
MQWVWFVAGASIGSRILLGVFVVASPSTVDVLWECSLRVLVWDPRCCLVSLSLRCH